MRRHKFYKKGVRLVDVVTCIASLLVGLGVGFAAIGEVLTIPFIPNIVMIIAGWIVVVTTLLAVVLNIWHKLIKRK